MMPDPTAIDPTSIGPTSIDPTSIDPATRDAAPITPATPEAADLSQGLKLAAIALVSAAVTATLVIAVGGALIQQSVSAG